MNDQKEILTKFTSLSSDNWINYSTTTLPLLLKKGGKEANKVADFFAHYGWNERRRLRIFKVVFSYE
ncbi:MAG: hypothetical protein ACXAD7_22770 [Candidatus Kariarchaeaceae archaeon]|jgi:hypothetical protein